MTFRGGGGEEIQDIFTVSPITPKRCPLPVRERMSVQIQVSSTVLHRDQVSGPAVNSLVSKMKRYTCKLDCDWLGYAQVG